MERIGDDKASQRDISGVEHSEAVSAENWGKFAGVPDEFQRLWTPHRFAYINRDKNEKSCPFCESAQGADVDGLVVHRSKYAYVLLNLYPYNSGHLLVCPYRHVALYDEITTEEMADIGCLTQTAMRVVRAVTGAHGFNIGMNQGAVAGAGVAAHLHQHLVPRWEQDSNFFPIIAKTKALSHVLEQMRTMLAEAWN